MLATRDYTIHDVLHESFSLNVEDGYWYPAEAPPFRSLVRVIVADSGYCVERRRGLSGPWAPIAAVSLAEFDADAFRTWRRSWRLLAA